MIAELQPSAPSTPGAAELPPVSSSLYSAELLARFAAGEHSDFLAAGGRPLRPRLARALALARLRPGLAVVDIGCGRGEAAAYAARRGARVTALDYSLGGLGLARQSAEAVRPAWRGEDQAVGSACQVERQTVGQASQVERQAVGSASQDANPALALPNRGVPVRLAAADATALPLANESADRVLLLDVVEHLRPWQMGALLAEVRRILKPDGYVIIHTLPNHWALNFAYPLLRLAVPSLPRSARSDYERAVHVNEQDPRSLARALRESGMAAHVWVEEWSTVHAARGRRRGYPDAARALGYPVLRRAWVERAARWAMRTPLKWVVANDLFAVAWPPGGAEAGPSVGAPRGL